MSFNNKIRVMPIPPPEESKAEPVNANPRPFLQDLSPSSGQENPTREHMIVEDYDKPGAKRDMSTIDREAGMRTIDVSSDELTTKHVPALGLKKHLDTSVEQIVTTPMVYEQPRVKSQIVLLNGVERVGEDWQTFKIFNKISGCNYHVWLIMNGRPQKIAYCIWSLVLLVGYFGFYLYFLALRVSKPGATAFVIDVFLVIIDPAYVYFASMELYHAWVSRPETDCYLTVYAWCQCMYSGMSLFVTVILASDSDVYACVFASAIYTIGIIQALNITLWILASPFLMVIGFCEFLIRLFMCRLACPYDQPKRKTYTYAVYRFGQGLAKEAKQCAICLGDYTADDDSICALKCMTSHVFHEKCIFEWLKKQEYCPVCRGEVKFNT